MKAIHTQEPRVINVDKNAAYPKAIAELKEKDELPELVELRQNKYLNNIVDSDLAPSLNAFTISVLPNLSVIRISLHVSLSRLKAIA